MLVFMERGKREYTKKILGATQEPARNSTHTHARAGTVPKLNPCFIGGRQVLSSLDMMPSVRINLFIYQNRLFLSQ